MNAKHKLPVHPNAWTFQKLQYKEIAFHIFDSNTPGLKVGDTRYMKFF